MSLYWIGDQEPCLSAVAEPTLKGGCHCVGENISIKIKISPFFSILRRTPPELLEEIILVDDCSDDSEYILVMQCDSSKKQPRSTST